MASTKQFKDEILATNENLSARPMMGEFLIYYRGKLIGGLYDNRFLLKKAKGLTDLIKEPIYQTPYPNAKEMVLVTSFENREFLTQVFEMLYNNL